ncbi:MAG TPA: hypothetical protein VF898_09185 [Chloroflexota bacterium]
MADIQPRAASRTARASLDGTLGQQDSGLNVTTITLPKSGGAIRGIGEKFAANPVNETGSFLS